MVDPRPISLTQVDADAYTGAFDPQPFVVVGPIPGGGGGGGAVDSVNGQTGTVVLDAEDVGALPDTYTPPESSRLQGQWNAGTVYAEGDTVQRGDNLYQAIAENTNIDPAAPGEGVQVGGSSQTPGGSGTSAYLSGTAVGAAQTFVTNTAFTLHSAAVAFGSGTPSTGSLKIAIYPGQQTFTTGRDGKPTPLVESSAVPASALTYGGWTAFYIPGDVTLPAGTYTILAYSDGSQGSFGTVFGSGGQPHPVSGVVASVAPFMRWVTDSGSAEVGYLNRMLLRLYEPAAPSPWESADEAPETSVVSQANIENPASTTTGLVTGERVAQAIAANAIIQDLIERIEALELEIDTKLTGTGGVDTIAWVTQAEYDGIDPKLATVEYHITDG